MITFNYETSFELEDENRSSKWVEKSITIDGFELGEINYVFCDDAYLLKLNIEFLQHDTFTDIISFDNTMGKLISGDIFISIDRIKENAKEFNVSFDNELHRVMIHGVLHYMGFKDKSTDEKQIMRAKESDCLNNIIN
jgi:rRNA maturation RNase YbeY